MIEIYNLDAREGEAPVCRLNKGDHNLGRGQLLKCEDKKVSRNHAVLRISNEAVTLTSTHQNPCFFQASNSKTVMILDRDNPKTVKDGDKFGLFPDKFWFKIKMAEEDAANNLEDVDQNLNNFIIPESSITQNPDINVNLENTNTEIATEIEQLSESDESVILDPGTVIEVDSTNAEDVSEAVAEVLENSQSEVVDEKSEEACTSNKNDPTSGDASTSNNDNTERKGAKRKLRERCKYGEKCFRKNKDHKIQFSHPTDSDYDSDPTDNRPICAYGSSCYRKNKEHREQYKHPRSGGSPSKKRKLRHRKKPRTSGNNSSEEDDYDHDDPFLDDSEDDYQEESWSEDSDSDFGDSQFDDRDENRSLIKEANRFTKPNRKN